MATSSQVNPTMMALNAQQIASLPAAEQAQYIAGLSPTMQQIYYKEQMVNANRAFMRMSPEKAVTCVPQGGSGGNTAAYVQGNTLFFDLPKVPGYAKALLINYNLTVTPAAGTGATYGLTAAAQFGMFSRIELDYNGPQVNTHPVMLAAMDVLQGYQRGQQNAVLAGNNDSTITNNLNGPTPIVIGAANTWSGKFLLRLNALGDDTVAGVLPCNGVGNSPTLKLTCTSSFVGQDPLYNVLAPIAGTGHSGTTVTGNISVDAIIVDGQTMNTITPLSLAWQQEPTLQYTWENALTPFNAGSNLQAKTISSKLKHWYAVAVVIDGNQANQFASLSNLTSFGLSPDSNGNQWFERWNIANNISIYDYFDRRVRRPFGQDLPEGVIPWVVGPCRGVIDSSNRNGSQFLNMQQGGFPASTHLYTVGSVGGQTTIDGYPPATPRVELFLVSENPAGLSAS